MTTAESITYYHLPLSSWTRASSLAIQDPDFREINMDHGFRQDDTGVNTF